MQQTTRQNRQGRGCGYETAPPPGMPAMPWQPPIKKLGYKHELPKLCAGYTTRLPEVIEVLRAWAHWKNGSLRDFCGGQPTPMLMELLERYDVEVERMKLYAITPRDKGGGAGA